VVSGTNLDTLDRRMEASADETAEAINLDSELEAGEDHLTLELPEGGTVIIAPTAATSSSVVATATDQDELLEQLAAVAANSPSDEQHQPLEAGEQLVLDTNSVVVEAAGSSQQDTVVFDTATSQETVVFDSAASQDAVVFEPSATQQGTVVFEPSSSKQDTVIFDPGASQQGTVVFDTTSGQNTVVFDTTTRQDTLVFDASGSIPDTVVVDASVPVFEAVATDLPENAAEEEEEDFEEIRKHYFSGLLEQSGHLWEDQSVIWNDVAVYCGAGAEPRDDNDPAPTVVRVPSLVMAAICPLFKAVAPGLDPELTAVSLPDVSRSDLLTFMASLWSYPALNGDEDEDSSGGDKKSLDQPAITRVMDVLCSAYTTENMTLEPAKVAEVKVDEGQALVEKAAVLAAVKAKIKVKAKRGRKPGKKGQPSQPAMKVEIVEKKRSGSSAYGLRRRIKRARFVDEVDPMEIKEEGEADERDQQLSILDDADEHDSDEYTPAVLEAEEKLADQADEEAMEELMEAMSDDLGDILDDEDVDDDHEDIDDNLENVEGMETDCQLLEETNPDLEENLTMYTVKVNPDGQAQVVRQEQLVTEIEEQHLSSQVPLPKPDRIMKYTSKEGKVLAKGKIVNLASNDQSQFPVISATIEKSQLMEKLRSFEGVSGDNKSPPLILFCSLCGFQCQKSAELRHHAASQHPNQTKFFQLPFKNPHANCAQCTVLMESYQTMTASNPDIQAKDLCFPCPHCRRRYMGSIGSLINHLHNDHFEAVDQDFSGKPEEYFQVKLRSDESSLTCDFCRKSFYKSLHLNAHLTSCPENDSGHSAALPCPKCDKTFHTLRHLRRHQKQKHAVGTAGTAVRKASKRRERYFCCHLCPNSFFTEAALDKHVAKEHSGSPDPDEGLVLHAGCDRCEALTKSYLANKVSKAVAFKDMAFRCPHCYMLLYANPNHAIRFLYSHVQKYHLDPVVNDLSLGPEPRDSNRFRLLSKKDPDLLVCPFCSHVSANRPSHNVHLTTCQANDVPVRPGYMCDDCGFVAGSAVHLRNHMETHNEPGTYKCVHCPFTCKSKRYLDQHILRSSCSKHSALSSNMSNNGRKIKSNYVPCPKCGKMRKEGSSIKLHVKKCGTGPLRVKCSHCDMEFKREEDMQAHSLVHFGQVTCPVHNVLFKNEDEIFDHVNVISDDDVTANSGDVTAKVKLQCCLCVKTFRHMCLFMKHLRQHLRISPYRCKICGKSVNTYASLQHHIKHIHNPSGQLLPVKKNDQKFTCNLCNRTFGARGHLKEHVLGVHDRSLAICCPICQKTFHTKKRMRKHLVNSHKDADPKDFDLNNLEISIPTQSVVDASATAVDTAPVTTATATQVIQFEIVEETEM